MDPISAFLLNNRRHREDDPSLVAEVESSVPFSSDHSTKSTGRSPDHTLERPRRNNSSDFMVPDPPNPHNSGQRTMPAFESRAQSSNPTINIRSEHISKAINNASKLETDAYAYVNGKQISASRISEERGWDIFRMLPPQTDKSVNGVWHSSCLQLLKISAFFILFLLTLCCAVIAKSVFLLMMTGIHSAGKNVSICTDKIPEARENTVFVSEKHVAKWVWAVFIALCAPELICFIRCFHRTMFRNVKRPTFFQFFIVLCVESLHAFGVGALVFDVFTNLPAVTAVMLSNALCLVPNILNLLSRRPNRWLFCLAMLDIGAIASQSTTYWAWPAFVPEIREKAIAICIYTTFISLAWWQNFVHPSSFLAPVRRLAIFAAQLTEKRSKTYVIISLWKCFIYAFCLLYFITPRIAIENLFQSNIFGERLITIVAKDLNQTQINQFQARMHEYETPDYHLPDYEANEKKKAKSKSKWNPDEDPDSIDVGDYVQDKEESTKSKGKHKKHVLKRSPVSKPEELEVIAAYNIYDDYVELNQFTTPYDAIWLMLFQIGAVALCYQSSKFACKVMMQRIGFALPILLAGPVTIAFLSSACEHRSIDPCHMTSVLSKEMFWQCHQSSQKVHFWTKEFWTDIQTLLWLGWLMAQIWVTIHLWAPEHERLAKCEKLFVLSYYSGVFVDQSLSLNRRKDDKAKIKCENLEMDSEDPSQTYETVNAFGRLAPPSLCSISSSKLDGGLIRDSASSADAISKIYVCATMWHETAFEMKCMLKSIFRLDEDQCARRNAQKYLKVVDPDYYEFEAHIFLDDSFDTNEFGELEINKYVKQIIENMDGAASAVHRTPMRLKTPKMCTVPYGGRLSYILPGRNRLTIHLKDKARVKQRKRWSQVMYLYYLLGYRLMTKVSDQARKEIIAENTYILTLDGDVDFTPRCVHLLVDLMKKNRRLGAACGRIHPRGSGLMIWYQKFEYAVGHWLQKATEHMIGCVLCSPGCFSLFRSYALMDDNVTRKYATKSEKPIHYVQYDQGEDRWLCTLLLQRGYRVEYCAASDALTFAPEGFNEFFNQRRRWIPSTLANIIDLIRDYRNVVAVNESISIWYIIYQFIMLVSSILGPGTIFLMVVGAISISFNIDTRLALLIVTFPVVLFCFCCLTCKTEKQLLLAQLFAALFAMLMTAVMVGTSLQIQKDGITSPHSIFLFAVIGSFTTAALLHPCEFSCVIPVILYFLAIPCMYMLLPIYSITNLNTASWGTREHVGDANEKKKVGPKRLDLVKNGMAEPDPDGELSFGCGSACRLMCCLKPNRAEHSPQLWKITEGLKEISNRLERLENGVADSGRTVTKRKLDNTHASENSCEYLEDEENLSDFDDNYDLQRHSQLAAKRGQNWKKPSNETWLNDKLLKRFERHCIDAEEESFWIDMIEKYLQPVAVDSKEQERIRMGLLELRNKMCSAFFMINVVFIIVVLVLQMQKDCLHIEWPLGPKFNHSITPCNSDSREEIWVMTRLQLEPIGLVFLVFFMSILIIQFVAMLLHRFATLAHIIASTELFCCKKPVDKLNEDELVVQNAVEIARELQAIRGVNEDPLKHEDNAISRRKVVQTLECSRRSRMKHETETLDAAFKKRFFALSSAQWSDGQGSDKEKRLTLRRSTIKALEHRRNSVFGTMDRKNVMHSRI